MKAPVEVQFAQKLAANEPPVRDKAVKKLKKWFGAKAEAFEEVEMMKIWKGLYYCFWMSDKPLVQEELAENISSFISCFQSCESSLLFIKSFLKTFGREWFGIDRWRSDKFMMFTRRFLRNTFKFVAAKEWEKVLVGKVVEIFRTELVLCPIADTSLGFQLHFTDVFLEELAKVGGEQLDPEVLEMFLDPYVEVVRVGDDARFRDHVVERIFNHLMRQSDPGIDWQMEEDGEGMEMEMEEDGEDGVDSDGEHSENGETNGDMNGDLEENEDDGGMKVVEDPRAGRVDAVIPQMNVEYLKISEKLFELGSGDGVRKANRDALYKISKMFKDVASDVFPLGPNLSDEEIDIPKISVKKSASELLKRNEEILQKNLEEKIKNKKLMSQMSKKAKLEAPQNGVDSEGSEDNDEKVNGDVDADSSSDEEPEIQEEKVEKEKKLSSKDLKRKRKQEQKKRKREKAFKLEQERLERINKAQQMIDQDLERKTAQDPVKILTNGVLQDKDDKIEEKVEKLKNIEKKKKKKEKVLCNGADVTNDSLAVQELIKMAEDLEEKSEVSAKKKKKKKDKKQDDEKVTVNTDLETSILTQNNENDMPNKEDSSPKEDLSESIVSVSKKKKKKKDRVEVVADSAVSSPNTSQFFTPDSSLVAAPENKDLDVTMTEELTASKKKKKKLKRTAAEAELGAESGKEEIKTLATDVEEVFIKPSEDVTTSLKKKKKKKKEMYRIDSDIAFNAPSLSKVNLMLEKTDSTKVEEKLAAVPEIVKPQPSTVPEIVKPQPSTIAETEVVSAKKKKKMKKYNAETSLLSANDEEATPKPTIVAPSLPVVEEKNDTPKSEKKKKKLKSNKLEFGSPGKQESGISPKSSKVFEEDNSWGLPLKPGETEIVLPNKKYKGSLKLSETPATTPESDALPGFQSPMVTPAKSYTSTFLKKALSKSVDPKKSKKEKKKSMEKEKCLSEPRKKKVNIVLTQNKSQDIPQHLKSVKNSPQTPHDPSRNPAKGVLKKRVSLESGTRLNPVQLNTQLNGRSKAAKVMVGKKRKSAMDFF